MMPYLLANSAYPTRHPSVHQIESEIVTMTLKLYNGGEDGVGCLTTCGTESIVLAMYGYR
jgi:sphinganine-1-phosphate aldolase